MQGPEIRAGLWQFSPLYSYPPTRVDPFSYRPVISATALQLQCLYTPGPDPLVSPGHSTTVATPRGVGPPPSPPTKCKVVPDHAQA